MFVGENFRSCSNVKFCWCEFFWSYSNQFLVILIWSSEQASDYSLHLELLVCIFHPEYWHLLKIFKILKFIINRFSCRCRTWPHTLHSHSVHCRDQQLGSSWSSRSSSKSILSAWNYVYLHCRILAGLELPSLCK